MHNKELFTGAKWCKMGLSGTKWKLIKTLFREEYADWRICPHNG